MPGEALLTLLTRALRQPEFRALLLADPEQALAGYVLTPAESYQLRTLTPALLDQLLSELKLHRTAPAGTRRSAN